MVRLGTRFRTPLCFVPRFLLTLSARALRLPRFERAPSESDFTSPTRIVQTGASTSLQHWAPSSLLDDTVAIMPWRPRCSPRHVSWSSLSLSTSEARSNLPRTVCPSRLQGSSSRNSHELPTSHGGRAFPADRRTLSAEPRGERVKEDIVP
jgi:hypothetical protein